jgi:hypothetical protein
LERSSAAAALTLDGEPNKQKKENTDSRNNIPINYKSDTMHSPG